MAHVDANGNFTPEGLDAIVDTVRSNFDASDTVKFRGIRIHDGEGENRDLTPTTDTLIAE